MGSSSVLERVSHKQSSVQRAKDLAWREIVRQLADADVKKHPPEDRIEAVLEECGKSALDLRNAVRAYERRAALYAKVAAVPALEAELAEVREKLATEGEKFSVVQSAFEHVARDLTSRIHRVAGLLSDAQWAQGDLARECPDAAAVGACNSAASALDEARRKLKKAKERRDNAARLAADAEAQIGLVSPYSQSSLKENAALYREREKEAAADVAAIESTIPEMEHAEEQARARLLLP